MSLQPNHKNYFNSQTKWDKGTDAGQNLFWKSFQIVTVNSDLPFIKLKLHTQGDETE